MRKGSEIWQLVRDGDFEEEDVWDVLRENSKTGKSAECSVSVARNLSSAARMIPRSNSSSNNSYHETRVIQLSAPVKIPNWSHISKKFNEDDDCFQKNSDDEAEGEEEKRDYDCKLPPHEVIAKRVARTQIASFSVFEGVGRKLKGRDLSEVRHAVLVKTGFLESP